MSEQMHSRMPITSDTLASIGIRKIGHRLRLMAHLLQPSEQLHPRYQLIATSKYGCYRTSPEIFVNLTHPSIEEWLQALELHELIPVF